MGRETLWEIFSQTHLVTLGPMMPDEIFHFCDQNSPQQIEAVDSRMAIEGHFTETSFFGISSLPGGEL
jgi:hypothetical protein